MSSVAGDVSLVLVVTCLAELDAQQQCRSQDGNTSRPFVVCVYECCLGRCELFVVYLHLLLVCYGNNSVHAMLQLCWTNHHRPPQLLSRSSSAFGTSCFS